MKYGVTREKILINSDDIDTQQDTIKTMKKTQTTKTAKGKRSKERPNEIQIDEIYSNISDVLFTLSSIFTEFYSLSRANSFV